MLSGRSAASGEKKKKHKNKKFKPTEKTLNEDKKKTSASSPSLHHEHLDSLRLRRVIWSVCESHHEGCSLVLEGEPVALVRSSQSKHLQILIFHALVLRPVFYTRLL